MKFGTLVRWTVIGVALGLSGCATGAAGSQSVAVSTVGAGGAIVGATCDLRNSSGESFVPSTPGAADVYRGSGVLSVRCVKAGIPDGESVVQSTMLSYPGTIVVRMGKTGLDTE